MSDFIRLTQRAPPGVADLATAYIYGIATSDEFPDGNNRTVWVVDLMFLAFSEVDAINSCWPPPTT